MIQAKKGTACLSSTHCQSDALTLKAGTRTHSKFDAGAANGLVVHLADTHTHSLTHERDKESESCFVEVSAADLSLSTLSGQAISPFN